MQEQHAFPFLREIILFLILAGILIPTLQRLRINQVLGFLVTGTLLGPFGLGLLAARFPEVSWLTFPSGEGVSMLAEVGVLFLMFMIGLELSAARLWAMRAWVFGAGTVQVAVSALLIGGAVFMLGQPFATAAILGLVLSLSSTAIVMRLMSAQNSTGSRLGQAVFAVLMLQDLAVVPILVLIGVLSRGAGDEGAATLALVTVAKAGGAIALIYLTGRRLIPRLFHAFTHHRQPDVFMALILLSTFGIAGLSAAAGLSMALGALIAGLLLAETEFRHEVELMIEPFKGLLMGLFFMSVGMNMDVRQVVEAPLWILAAVLSLVLIKAGVIAIVFRLGRMPWSRAIEGGLMLSQGGEFVFVVLGYAISAQLLDPALGARVMLVAGLSMFITPMLARLGHAIGERGEHAAHERDAQSHPGALAAARGRIIIAGFGRVGQQLAKLLSAERIPFIAFENDASLVSALHAQGLPVFFGNASRAELLCLLHAGEAPAIVLTMDNPASALQSLHAIRRNFPHVPVFARARDEQHARSLKRAGATVVVPETLEASLQLSAFVLESMGIDERTVDDIVDNERDLFAAQLSDAGLREAASHRT